MIFTQIHTALLTQRDHLAYCSIHGTRTYAQLAHESAAIQHFLREYVPEHKPIVLWGQKEPLMISALLACVLSGYPYVPIDSGIPRFRLEALLAQIQPALILAVAPFPLSDARCVDAAHLTALCNGSGQEPRLLPVSPERAVYHLYTSGSSGTPKGVVIRRKDLCCFSSWMQSLFPEAPCRILNQASFSFDLSVADLYQTLSTGAALYAPDVQLWRQPMELFRFLMQSNAELAVFTPSFAELLIADAAFCAANFPALKTIFFCGENLKPSLVRSLWARFPHLRIINAYGPTECTVAVSAADITPQDCTQTRLPVGCARPGTALYTVDENGHCTASGAEGEIVIGGAGVSPGYLNGGSQFCLFNGEPAFFTGDFGHIENGVLYVHGRTDRQIKLHGYRIELDEVEAHLSALNGVRRAAVLPQYQKDGSVRRLIAFAEMNDVSVLSAELRQHLAQRLPAYMLPVIRIIPQLPITKNGKTDYRTLYQHLEIL